MRSSFFEAWDLHGIHTHVRFFPAVGTMSYARECIRLLTIELIFAFTVSMSSSNRSPLSLLCSNALMFFSSCCSYA